MLSIRTARLKTVRGHGTGVAGLIAAKNNNIDILGVASGATLYAVKVLGDDGIGDESDSIAGLQWVADNHNKVTPNIRARQHEPRSRAFGWQKTSTTTPMLAPIKALYDLGIPVIVSAGNDAGKEVTDMVPAGYQEVFAIGATVTIGGHSQCPDFFGSIPLVPADTSASFTTDGEFLNGRGITISAPGEAWSDTFWPGDFSCLFFYYGVRTTMLGGGASRKIRTPDGDFEARGTSFAAPLVTGAVARIMQLGLVNHSGDSAEVESIRTYLRDNADRKATSPGDTNAAPLDHPWVPYGPRLFLRQGTRRHCPGSPWPGSLMTLVGSGSPCLTPAGPRPACRERSSSDLRPAGLLFWRAVSLRWSFAARRSRGPVFPRHNGNLLRCGIRSGLT